MRLSISAARLPRWLLALFDRRGVTSPSLDDVSPSGPRVGPDLLMPRRAEAHGLDPAYIANAQPELYRTLEEACGRCGNVTRCAHDLSQDDADTRLNAYCANTAALDQLLLRK
jgi:hypothetical protein